MTRKLFAAITLCGFLPCAQAATGYYLVSVYDVEGQHGIDYKYWNADYTNSSSRSSPEIGYSYGVTSRWYTELSAVWFRAHGRDGSELSAFSWQNDVLLTQGQYAADVALHTELARSTDKPHVTSLEIGPVLQTEYYRTQFNANLFLQRDVKGKPGAETQLAYQWQIKQRWKSWLQPGIQGFGEVGKWNDWLPRERQSHRAGPAVFGSVDAGPGQEIKYEAAWLVGKNSARSAQSFTMRVQYLFR
ncbi:hypothetical protein GJ700_29670 [Duganella sp. FT92W]|uniref:DUF2490 domain-containing protein n=1 Tax=Pseudoduganella rivuli TaxID=2666085 RepID=A0A7X2ITT1_9BURK|nr:hypothetical protein [Pseudoduganella rivuli]MRV75889.1 hypothetical protein [Pseudoduganella rivuli]